MRVLAAALFAVTLGALRQQPVRCPPVPAMVARPPAATRCTLDCGKERWAVKTLSDGDAGRVDLTPRRTTIRDLGRLARPRTLEAEGRASPVERRAYCVEGVIRDQPRPQGDGDLHVILEDPDDSTSTLIIELPDPRCPSVCASRHASAMQAARAEMERLLQLWTSPTMRVTVVGVGFFDRDHGQVGAARNFIELHPVLAVALVE